MADRLTRRQVLAGSGGAPNPDRAAPGLERYPRCQKRGISAIFSKPISAIRCRPRAAFGWTYLAS